MVSSRKAIPSENDLEFRPTLKSLVLRHSLTGEQDEENLEWLFAPHQGLFNITQLGRFVFSGEGHIQAARILSLSAESIKSLELKMNTTADWTYNTPFPSWPIDLDVLSDLTKLTIIAKVTTTDDAEYSSPLPWLAARLELLTPVSNLSEIILQLNLSVPDAILQAIDWTDITRILSSMNLPNLNFVTLKVSGRYNPLSSAQWAVLRNNGHLSPLIDDGRLVMVNSNRL